MMVTSGLSRLEGLGDSVGPGWENEAVATQRDPSQVTAVEGSGSHSLPSPHLCSHLTDGINYSA